MPNCKSFLVTQAERKHVRLRARFQQYRRRELSSRFFHPHPTTQLQPQGKAPKEIHAILTDTLEEHAPSYATVKNWVAQFKPSDFSTYDEPRPGRPKTVTATEMIDQIHELILEDQRISAKSIAEQLGISRERVGSIIHEDLDMRKLSAKWVPKFLKAYQIGVPSGMLSLIQDIYTRNYARKKIERKLEGKIPVNQGIRQGDSLSPLLFNP